jgi:glycosyltransferase involved in cell wall biosynthesis
MMHLDILIPTYRRPALLARALGSIARARVPEGLTSGIIVVNNNSGDETPQVVEDFARRAPLPVRCVTELKQGLSHARNAGIAASSADLIGMIDDDEEIAEDWLEVAERSFRGRPELAFIGGPYHGNWSQDPPAWLPSSFRGVVGEVNLGPAVKPFTQGGADLLLGGNAVVRREWLERAGPYNPALGRSGANFASGEDLDMFDRLTALGARGEYRPDLVIHHYIPPERLTKRYFRRWAWGNGHSLGMLHRARPEPVPQIAGIPRYRIRVALEAGVRALFRAHRRWTAPGEAFAEELRLREFGGFLAGRFRTPSTDHR